MREKTAGFLGFDLSTTALSCGVRSVEGQEGFVSIPMRGKTEWNGQPAHDLSFVPGMILKALRELQKKGWKFNSQGSLSFSVRQHDMVLLDVDFCPLMPALSWQCKVADVEANTLNEIPSIVSVVGKVEPRFILPKLIWAMRNCPVIAEKVGTVVTTGDYIAGCLTDNYHLSTSDGLSNGLLNQITKKLPLKALAAACKAFKGQAGDPGIFAGLFPGSVQSGTKSGIISPTYAWGKEWLKVANILGGWQIISCLGDNHAGGVGCGLAYRNTIVISAGTSGTVIRRCKPQQPLVGKAACFEYYNDRLLLMMLADCAAWYDEFVKWYTGGESSDLAKMDLVAMSTDPDSLEFWPEKERKKILKAEHTWNSTMIANAQFSIALELLARVRDMLAEVKGSSAKIDRFVLTGGLSLSQFFQEVITAGVGLLVDDGKVFVSDRKGPFASQAATTGAMINAMVGAGYYKNLASAISQMCPLRSVAKVDALRIRQLCVAIKRNRHGFKL